MFTCKSTFRSCSLEVSSFAHPISRHVTLFNRDLGSVCVHTDMSTHSLHPMMLHSRVNNKNRDIRIVTNNNLPLREPFNYNRSDPSQYSLIERATLKALGKSSLPGWRITGKREMFVAPYANRGRGSMKERQQAERTRVAEGRGRGHNFQLF